jgi:hypothetical protein
MTTIDIINRINEDIRTGDIEDLEFVAGYVRELLIEGALIDALIALIQTAQETIER